MRLPLACPEPPPRWRAHAAWAAGLAAAGVAWYGAGSITHRREQRHGYALRGPEIDVGSDDFLHTCEALTSAPISEGNDLDVLVNGDAIFPIFLEEIRKAERTVNLETYVYWRGDIAHEVASTLCEKARDGVECNVILDAVGAAKMERRLMTDMREAGVSVALFRPPKPYALTRLNNRTHRKLLVVDGTVGMTGGVGIAEEWTGDAQDPDHWRDTHVRVTGPVVRGLQGAFAENWLEATGDVLVGEDYLPHLDEIEDGGPMQLVRSRATVGDTNIEALYFLAIACARETLDLTAAYFAPRPAFVDALCDASGRGVRVRILVPGSNIDKEFIRLAGRAEYERLLEAGVEVYEYRPTMLHAKTMCIDGCWSSIGSVNFDNRSFQQNDEATLCVQSSRVAGELTKVFEADLELSEPFELHRWRRRPVHKRAVEQTLKLARREL
ncbi:MAG TPA: phospholipase D-like domain-containing protein [Capillimicrobium sp.]|nr:phospholipase D-like domain-containing protein [Capillimicrobium sp.]